MEENLWGLVKQGFYGPDVLPVTQPCQSTEGNTKHYAERVSWSHPLYIHHCTPDGYGVVPFDTNDSAVNFCKYSAEDISDCEVLRHVTVCTLPCQPNFGQNRLKSRKIGTNLRYT